MQSMVICGVSIPVFNSYSNQGFDLAQALAKALADEDRANRGSAESSAANFARAEQMIADARKAARGW